MRFMTTLVLGTMLALPAVAQTTSTTTSTATTTAKPHHTTMHRARTAAPRETVDDKGPFTPEANAAYNGGGAILEGAPGGPPPPASAVVGMPTGQPLPPPRR